MLTDQPARENALNPSHSFIVQAPAGSGKTQLLTQRFLRLLTTVKQPEEIIAITFTKKAAAEMKERIINTLYQATDNPANQLANNALLHAQKQQWNLLNNPNRLQVMTIDALCAKITSQSPLQPYNHYHIAEQPYALYEQAVDQLLNNLDSDLTIKTNLTILLTHLDNRLEKSRHLFAFMLSHREQWLDFVVGLTQHSNARSRLEAGLKRIIKHALQTICFEPDIETILNSLIQFASTQNNEFYDLQSGLPPKDIEHLQAWQQIANLLLTNRGTFRKTVSKNQGFPAKTSGKTPAEKTLFSEKKAQMHRILNMLSENTSLESAVFSITQLPNSKFDETQWDVISALLTLLPRLVAELQLVFSQEQCVDFTQVSLNALHALGDLDNITDLSLLLDHQLSHLLVDEYQDTSYTQLQLLEKLTQGWQLNDRKTLFIVGDPMQSIYRFRQADVGLFLKAKNEGIGHIPLTFLALHSNFRSNANIVNWLNTQMPAIFGHDEDPLLGAMCYNQASPTQAVMPNHAIHYYLSDSLANNQTEQLVQTIKQLKQISPKDSIAILVRSRNHLTDLLPALQLAGLNIHAVDIAYLNEKPVIRDLIHLTLAFTHLTDRIAWIGFLRAPCCGLTLKELTLLIGDQSNDKHCIIDCIFHSPEEFKSSSRFALLQSILKHAWDRRYQHNLAQTIYGIWKALGGEYSYDDPDLKNNVDTFFNLLKQHSETGDLTDRTLFLRALNTLFAKSNNTDPTAIEVMTLHKAKGLEFDHVILPYLERIPPIPTQPLLRWQWIEQPDHIADLLLAPIKSQHAKSDPVYRYLQSIEQHKAKHELTRLLYVGLTRAKSHLYLFGSAEYRKEAQTFKKPKANSLLQLLWEPFLQEANIHLNKTRIECEQPNTRHQLDRLPNTLILETDYFYQTNTSELTLSHKNHPVYYSIINRALGTVIHECLEIMANQDIHYFDQHKTKQYKPYWRQTLSRLSVFDNKAEQLIETVIQTIQHIQADPKAHWILAKHHDAQHEITLSFYDNHQLKNIIIDRTFIDDHHRRWIIDYKTAIPDPDDDINDWLAKEKKRYLTQLTTYARAFSKIEKRPIHLGLYFVRTGLWIEWVFEKQAERSVTNSWINV